jgi:hypothetical protein
MPKTVVNVTYSTLEQAETEVFRLIESKTNYRDICQIEFMINGIKKKFSLSQISKIKQKLSPKNNSNSLETKTDSEQKAELFELFKNKESIVDVIIKTKLDSKLVDETYQEFTKLSSIFTVDATSLDYLRKNLYPLDKKYGYESEKYDTAEEVLQVASDYLVFLDRK